MSSASREVRRSPFKKCSKSNSWQLFISQELIVTFPTVAALMSFNIHSTWFWISKFKYINRNISRNTSLWGYLSENGVSYYLCAIISHETTYSNKFSSASSDFFSFFFFWFFKQIKEKYFFNSRRNNKADKNVFQKIKNPSLDLTQGQMIPKIISEFRLIYLGPRMFHQNRSKGPII